MQPASSQPAYATDPAQLPALLWQLVADLANPAVSYLLAGHYYDRTNHPRTRHFPAVFCLQQGQAANVEVGPDSVAFDTELLRYPERNEPHYPGPWADRFRATVPYHQLYQLCRQVLPPTGPAATVSYGSDTIVYYNEQAHKQPPKLADLNRAYPAASAGSEHPLPG